MAPGLPNANIPFISITLRPPVIIQAPLVPPMGCRLGPRVERLLRGSLFPGSGCNEISVVSWNVLAPGADGGMKVDWDTQRLPCLLEHLWLYVSCDIICLQELEKGSSLEKVQGFLAEQGFACETQQREGKNSFHVVNATFFKADRFRVNWSESRSRVLLTGLLLPNGREICVLNVHLAANGAAATRSSQLAHALQKMQGIISSYKIICGDFNDRLESDSPLIPLLAELGVSRTAPCGFTHYCGLALDHICVSSGLSQQLVLTSTQKELADLRQRSLPDTEHPSDHFPVAGLFHLKPSDWQLPKLPEVPHALPGELEAWRELCLEDLQPLPRDKKLRKEQRKAQQQLEESFFSALPGSEQGLRKWREETQAAARALCVLVLDDALAAVRKQEKTDGVT